MLLIVYGFFAYHGMVKYFKAILIKLHYIANEIIDISAVEMFFETKLTMARDYLYYA